MQHALHMEHRERASRIAPHIKRRGRALAFDVDSGRRNGSEGLVRLHRAHYLPLEIWEELDFADRHLARLLAITAAAERPPVFSHISAAVLHGLPLYGVVDESAHVITGIRGPSRASAGLVRHRSYLPEDEVRTLQDMRCTSPERTILDLCRDFSIETALVCADGHLRESFRARRAIDEDRFAEWRSEMLRMIGEQRGRRGARSMRQMLELADPRKDSVLESISHLRLRQLGFEVELQVPVRGRGSSPYYVDFELVGLRLFGECDGKLKYTDEQLLAGRSPAEAIYEEKRRQDWICGVSGNRMIRWGYSDVRTTTVFARRLRAFKVPIPLPPRE